jgi:acyl-CoA thioester hydrolase
MKKAAIVMNFRVPFGDVDMMGHLNNAKYLTYFETARTSLLLQSFRDFPHGRLSVIVAHAEVDYKSPARWNDELEVKVRPISIGNSSFTYEYEVTSKQGYLVATGKTVQVAYDYSKNTSVPVPEAARTILSKQIEETRD